MSIKNVYKSKRLIYRANAFVYCPMGKDWGKVRIEADIEPDELLPDYLDIDNYIREEIEDSTHITEEVGLLVYEFIKKDISPKALTVTVHAENDSMHECYTTIGE